MITFVLRLLPDRLADGEVVGEVQCVDPDRTRRFAGTVELERFLTKVVRDHREAEHRARGVDPESP